MGVVIWFVSEFRYDIGLDAFIARGELVLDLRQVINRRHSVYQKRVN